MKISFHLSSLTEVVTTLTHSELVLAHLSSKLLQMLQGLLVIRKCQLSITQLILSAIKTSDGGEKKGKEA